MGITACFISKNEEENIERALKSIVDAVDEIIVVDTGSTDNTIEIAKKYGAKVYNYAWEYDFSKARNYSLDKASEPWIFVIDCDEELDRNTIPRLKDLTRDDTPFEGFGVIISNIIGGKELYTNLGLRLFRNKPEYRYEGEIHEQVGHKITEKSGEYSVLSSEIKLYHYGYETIPELEEKKTKRNIEILEKVKEEKRDGLYYLHLGNEYSRMNDIEKSIEIYKKSFEISPKDSAYYTMVVHRFIEALYKKGDLQGVVAYGEPILMKMMDFKALSFLVGVAFINLANYHKALKYVSNYLEQKDQLSKYPNVQYDSLENIQALKLKLENICNRKQ